MSTRRGGATKGAPKHQNSFAFKHNKNSIKTKTIQVIPIEGVCPRCAEILLWRKKYRKYKPRTKPGKCNSCHLPKVRHAYHQLCSECAKKDRKCGKCCGPIRGEHRDGDGELAADPELLERRQALTEELETLVESAHPDLTERQRRSRIREIQRELDDGEDGDEGEKDAEENVEGLSAAAGGGGDVPPPTSISSTAPSGSVDRMPGAGASESKENDMAHGMDKGEGGSVETKEGVDTGAADASTLVSERGT